MGYEIRLHIGRLTDSAPIKKKGHTYKWLYEYARIDLCKCGYDGEIYNLTMRSASQEENRPEPQRAFWYGENDKPIIEDCYAAPLYTYPLGDFLKAVKVDLKTDQEESGDGGYRRFRWAKALLSSMNASADGEDLVVVVYGH